jgi:RNA polymerase sigma factor for flagellar operon FliA
MMGTMKSSQNRERMLFDQLPLVKIIARRIYYRLPKHVLLEDLVQAGMVGLLDAWQKYDCNRRVQFGSYAKVRIRGAILDSLRELDWGPRSLRSIARRAEEARNALRRARDLDQLTTVSFQSDSNGEDHPQDFVDCPTSPPDESPYCIRLRTEVTDLLRTLISKLPDRQRDVLTLYYQQNLTMKEIGTTLGLGESRVSQLHSLAVNGLRERLQDLGHGAHETHVDPVARLLQP